MKKCMFFLANILPLMIIYATIQATSLDGTSTVNYQSNPYVFRDGDYARGIVCFGKGFTVIPGPNHGSNLFLDTNISISGAIDLRGTSTMTLLHDVLLDNGVTFSDSGRIYSYGSSLIMGGNLTIPADKILHCGGNLIIDGRGNTLSFGSNAQLFLDNATTVTLRNMVINTKHSFPGAPALTLSSSLSKLILDNVVLALADDWYFNQGQLFIHNDVEITGTSAIVYRSIAPSYIASQSCLMFDHGTTFSYAPATENKDLIVMNDSSSALAFNGCSLKSTHTGLRLTKGRLYFDNKVNLDSLADNKLNALITTTWDNYGTSGSSVLATAWSPSGNQLAICGINPYGGNELWLYNFSGSALSKTDSKNYGSSINSVAWSPDGQYLAIGGQTPEQFGEIANTNELQIYRYNGGSLAAVISQDYGNTISSVAWSPDGKYLAIGGNTPTSGDEIQIYRFDGTALTTVNSQDYGTSVYTIAWSPDGNYLAIGGNAPTSGNELQVYRFNGSVLSLVDAKDYGSYIFSVAWSPDGRYLAIGGSGPSAGPELQIYRFNGTTLTSVINQEYGSVLNAIAWSPDGQYMAIGGYYPTTFGGNSNYTDEIQIYRFNGTSLAPATSQNYGSYINALSWSRDGNFITIGGEYPTGNNEIWVDRCLFVNEAATQSMDKGIVFGNSDQGPTADIDIHVLSDARIEINGNVFHNPA